MTMVTTTLFKVVQSELIKLGRNEFEGKEKQTSVFDFGTFDYYKDDVQFTRKIFKYDGDIKKVVDNLFSYLSLDNEEHDSHFKKMFIFHFLNRQINKQTIEAFKYDLAYMFMSKKFYIESLYNDIEKYILNQTNSNATNESHSSTDNTDKSNDTSSTDNMDRSATSDLPNSTLSFNLDDDTFSNPSTADARKNRSVSKGEKKGESKTLSNTDGLNTDESINYNLDTLIKSSYVFNDLIREFDRKCFLQVW